MSDILLKLRAAVVAKRAADDALYALAETLAGQKLATVEAEDWSMLALITSQLSDSADGTIDIAEEHAEELKADWSEHHVPQ